MTPLYVFDIDGTLADGSHRVHLITQEPKRWDEYFELCDADVPIPHMVELLKTLWRQGADIRIFSGRNNMVRAKTELWLRDQCQLPWTLIQNHLRMRPYKDHRPDDELKEMWLNDLSPGERARLQCVFDDRNRVVEMWRRNGVPCLQVAPGDF